MLVVLDGSDEVGPADRDLLSQSGGEPPPRGDEQKRSAVVQGASSCLGLPRTINVSARTGEGLDVLRAAMLEV